LNPLIVHWNSSTAYLDPLSDLSGAKRLASASIGSGTIQVQLSFLDPLAPNQPQRTKAYPRSVGTVMAIGLDANQLSDQFLASLESKTNADALSVRSGQSTFDQAKIADLLALSVNAYFSGTDEGQNVVNNLFRTVRDYNGISAGVASSGQSLAQDNTGQTIN